MEPRVRITCMQYLLIFSSLCFGNIFAKLLIISVLETIKPNYCWFSTISGTVADNVRYGPQLRGEKLTDKEVHDLLGIADLDPALASRPSSELSIGQAQRVALARTLANNPEVLILPPFDMCMYKFCTVPFPSLTKRQKLLSCCIQSMCEGFAIGWTNKCIGSDINAEHRRCNREVEEDAWHDDSDGVP